jgi:uncharacterized membrane protein YeaQ/YmgE (transglycosylase-associated protein family)
MHILWMIIIGFIAGVIAKWVLPGKNPGGIITTTLLGIAGAVVMTFLGRFVGWYQEGETGGFIAAIIGAILVLAVYHYYQKKKAA